MACRDAEIGLEKKKIEKVFGGEASPSCLDVPPGKKTLQRGKRFLG